jgi:hypothetical protein
MTQPKNNSGAVNAANQLLVGRNSNHPPVAGVAQPQPAKAAQMKKAPVAPPVYRAQPAPQVAQPKLAQPTTVAAQPPKGNAARPAAPPASHPPQGAQAIQRAQVIQCAPCQVCRHTHGSVRCTRQIGTPPRACGCTSHSSHWGKGAKFNPGSGRHQRRMAARKG